MNEYNDSKNYGVGWGLIQWSYSRKTDLLDFANKQGKSLQDLGDLDLQLEFLVHEFKGPERNNYLGLLKIDDVALASDYFVDNIERASVEAYPKRQDASKDYLGKYGGGES